MRLFVLGQCPDFEVPHGVVGVVMAEPGPDPFLPDGPVSIAILCRSARSLGDRVLESVEEVVESPDPVAAAISMACGEDLALLAWDDSDAAYVALRGMLRRGVMVFDPSDGYRMLEISRDVDHLVDAITRRVTTDVIEALGGVDFARRPRGRSMRGPSK